MCSSDLDVTQLDFKNEELQIVVLAPLEKVIFSRAGMAIYKCIPKQLADNVNALTIQNIESHVVVNNHKVLYQFYPKLRNNPNAIDKNKNLHGNDSNTIDIT